MKKACPYCGKIHEYGYICDRKPVTEFRQHTKKATVSSPKKSYPRKKRADIFRSSYDWKTKRENIKARDRYLCRACLAGLPGTVRRINPYGLSVHHILSLSDNYDLRLSDDNLITLCRVHHEAAESGLLTAQALIELLRSPPRG